MLQQFQCFLPLLLLIEVPLLFLARLIQLLLAFTNLVDRLQELLGLLCAGLVFNALPVVLEGVQPGFVEFGVFASGLVLCLANQLGDSMLGGRFAGLLFLQNLK